jgi:ParB-like chromosome segregation protein Spo0J
MPENSGCTPGGEFKATDVRVQALSVSQIKLDGRNSRTHSAKQIRQIANSIIAFGFTNPLLVNENAKLIAGEGRLKAAQLLGFAKVPAIVLAGLSPARQRALAIADNKIAENAGWDRERLAIEIPELTGLLETEGLDVSILGFAAVEIDQLVTDFEETRVHVAPLWLHAGVFQGWPGRCRGRAARLQ